MTRKRQELEQVGLMNFRVCFSYLVCFSGLGCLLFTICLCMYQLLGAQSGEQQKVWSNIVEASELWQGYLLLQLRIPCLCLS